MSAESTPGVGSRSILRWLGQRAENVAVALIAAMFVSFLLQIVFRYALNQPLGWTEEVTVLCWLWLVLWGTSFLIRDEEEIRFDILVNAVSSGVRRVFTITASLAMIVLMAWSLPATWHYITFMRREHSAYLHMRFDYLYSIYLLFAVVCIIRQAVVAWRAWNRTPASSAAVQKDAAS
jgi:C4-dicarboxylate transporter DctQ subunit